MLAKWLKLNSITDLFQVLLSPLIEKDRHCCFLEVPLDPLQVTRSSVPEGKVHRCLIEPTRIPLRTQQVYEVRVSIDSIKSLNRLNQ